MRRRSFLAGLVTVAAAPLAADAQPAGMVPRIGLLRRGTLEPSRLEAFRQGLRALGYIEGQNVEIVQRYANEVAGRLPALAAELVRLKVDVIVADETATVRAAKTATTTIPIVFTLTVDPVGTGLVGSLARPGGNVTGLTQRAPELLEKRLELLKEVVPGLSRVALLMNPVALELRQFEGAARALGIHVQVFAARDLKEIERAFSAMAQGGVSALIPHGEALFFSRRHLVELASKNRFPAIYEERSYVEAGGLMAYGTSYPDLFRRAATYVDKVLKGAKPADLPVEQPTKFELVINLKTAKALGLTIPPSLLLRADQVIE